MIVVCGIKCNWCKVGYQSFFPVEGILSWRAREPSHLLLDVYKYGMLLPSLRQLISQDPQSTHSSQPTLEHVSPLPAYHHYPNSAPSRYQSIPTCTIHFTNTHRSHTLFYSSITSSNGTQPSPTEQSCSHEWQQCASTWQQCASTRQQCASTWHQCTSTWQQCASKWQPGSSRCKPRPRA